MTAFGTSPVLSEIDSDRKRSSVKTPLMPMTPPRRPPFHGLADRTLPARTTGTCTPSLTSFIQQKSATLHSDTCVYPFLPLIFRPPRAISNRQNSAGGGQHISRSSAAGWQVNRPASLGDSRRRIMGGGGEGSMSRITPGHQKPPRGSSSTDQEHELIAQYSQSLRRQSSPALVSQ